MDQIPQEIVDRISSHLSRDDLKNTLLVSQAFRFSAEKYSRAFEFFNLNEDSVERFISTFSGHRLLYLRNVRVTTRLPHVRDEESRDNADQLRENDNSFTRQIASAFKSLKTVEDRAGCQNGPGKIRLTVRAPMRTTTRNYPITYHEYSSWRVHLFDPDVLPLLESIRSVEFKPGGPGVTHTSNDSNYEFHPMKLDYRVMVDLVVKFPNLEYWGCRVGGDEWSPRYGQEAATYLSQDWAGPRRDTRLSFAKALFSASLPVSLRYVRLDFLHELYYTMKIDHYTSQPDMVSPAVNDIFSNSLHHLSHKLRRLHLRVVADETLFWPRYGTTLSWPNLEILVVMFHMVSPSGHWYFKGPSHEGCDTAPYRITESSYPPLETTDYDREMIDQIDDEGDLRDRTLDNTRFRVVPNDAILRPFLAAFAKAASNMTSLKEAAIWCPLAWGFYEDEDGQEMDTDWLPPNCPDRSSLAWGINYLAPGEAERSVYSRKLPSKVPQLWWRVAKWRPDPELHQLFQQIGRNSWGSNLQEHWEDEEYGEGLVDREYFESHLDYVDSMGRIPPPA